MESTIRAIQLGLCTALTAITLVAQPMPQTTKEVIKGTARVTTEEFNGTVIMVEGDTLVVRMASGDIREFQPPASRRFQVDGRELTLHELRPGTKLHATLTTTTTPVTERTTTVGTGKVFFVSGNTVILTLPNNENRMYKVQPSYRFNIGGEKATVHELRKGMNVSAEKIVEEPRTEIAANTVVTGSAPPPPKPVKAEVPASLPAPAPHAAPAPVQTASAEPPPSAPASEPTRLPKTGSLLPLIGLLGLLCTATSLGLRTLRRFQ